MQDNRIDIWDDFEIALPNEPEGVVQTTQEPSDNSTSVTQENVAQHNEGANTSGSEQGTQSAQELQDESEFALIARRYAERGLLEDSDITPTMDFDELANKFQNKLEKRSEDLIRQKFYEELASDGITTEDLNAIKLQKAGVGNNDLQQLEIYGVFSSIDYNKIDESIREGELLAVTIQKYLDMGLDSTKAERNAKADIDEDFDKTIKDNAQYFYKKYEQKDAEIKHKETTAKKQKEETARVYRQNIESKIKTGKIGSVELTPKEIEKVTAAFFNATEVVRLEDGSNVKVTKLMAEKLKLRQNPDALLEQDINLILGRTTNVIAQKAKEQGADELANRFINKAKSVANSTIPSINNEKFVELDLDINN